MVRKRKARNDSYRRVVAEAHGVLPLDMEILHINGNATDNRIENLVPLTRRDHKMLHAGGVCKFGTWFFVCSRCRREMPFYCFHAGKYKAGCFLCRSAGNKRKAVSPAFRRVRSRSNQGLALNGTAVVLGV